MTKFLLILAGVFLLIQPSLARPSLVKLCSDPSAPMILGEIGKESQGGFSSETLKEVFKRMNIKLELPLRPWKQCLKLVEHGKMDGLQTCIYSKNRMGYLSVTDPWIIGGGVWYYMKNKFPQGFEWNSYEDFKGYKIVGIAGSYYGKEFVDAQERGVFKFHAVKNIKTLIKVFSAGLHDFTLELNITGDHMLNSAGLKGQYASPSKPLFVNAQRICIGKKSALHELIPEINDKLSELKAEGIINDIVKGKSH